MKTFDKIYTAAMFLEDHNVEPLNIRIMEDINGYKIVHLYISPIEFKISYPDVKAWHITSSYREGYLSQILEYKVELNGVTIHATEFKEIKQ